jgi:hypothetical protein
MVRRITDHRLWPDLLPLLYVQNFKRSDGGKRLHPRERIEVREPSDRALRAALLAIEIACAHCRRPIVPVRARNATRPGWSWAFLSVSCEQTSGRQGCSRGSDAQAEVERIKSLLAGRPHPTQPELFEV